MAKIDIREMDEDIDELAENQAEVNLRLRKLERQAAQQAALAPAPKATFDQLGGLSQTAAVIGTCALVGALIIAVYTAVVMPWMLDTRITKLEQVVEIQNTQLQNLSQYAMELARQLYTIETRKAGPTYTVPPGHLNNGLIVRSN